MTPARADLAVPGRFADPRALLAAGAAELTRLITSASGHQQGHQRARQWRAAAAAAIDLYGDHPAVPFEELAAEVTTGVRLLRAIGAELAGHAAAREQHYRHAGPAQLARSLPGFAEISAPVLVAVMGRPGRFRNGTKFKSYAGLAPKASETGETDRKGQSMSTAGPSLLRATLFRAAGTARRQDPQLARIYHVQMTKRGATHLKARCVVAGHLAERAWTVLNRGTRSVAGPGRGRRAEPSYRSDAAAESAKGRAVKAIVQHEYGAPMDVLRLAGVAMPAAGAEDVLVSVRASSANPMGLALHPWRAGPASPCWAGGCAQAEVRGPRRGPGRNGEAGRR